ncbi:MAG TPA: Ku protein [Candidatus Dormibacteraeota bacterium]|jgi:DNA end-binding protein Ku
MPRSMWKGVITFGMVSIPVRLYVATDSQGISFRQLCAEHMSPIKYKRWCSEGDHEVSYGDIVKGYEVSTDNYVVIEDADLDNLPLPTAHAIEITEFVEQNEINGGLYFKSAYYMEPEEVGKKPYALLKQALEETKKVAVAKIAFRDREHLAALSPLDGHMLMNTLHWPDEIRSVDGIKGVDDGVKISDRELQMAKTLVESLSDTFDPERFQDNYKEALMKVVEAKVQGQETVTAPEPETAPRVMDLMEALKASVEAAKKSKPEAAEAAKPAKQRARKAS